jgi:hypothetical protein
MVFIGHPISTIRFTRFTGKDAVDLSGVEVMAAWQIC